MKDLASLYLHRNGDATLVAQALALAVTEQAMKPTQVLAEPFDARVISGAEVRHMALGKLEETISEMQRLKKELKGGAGG